MSTNRQPERPRLRHFLHPRLWPALLLLAFVKLFSFLPLQVTWLLGLVFGELAFRLHRTPTIRTNIQLCFPDKSQQEQRRLVRQYYRRIGQGFFDLGLAWMSSPERLRRLVNIKGLEHYRSALESGRGVVLLAPHFVGLEIGFARIGLEHALAHMYRKPKNERLHKTLYYFRTRHGGMGFERYDSLKPLIRFLRQGNGFYYLPDQDPDHPGKDYVFAPFFGVPTATYTALARFVEMGQAVVIPCFTYQLPKGAGYEVCLKPPLENFPTGDEVVDATTMNHEIENGVLVHPDQYFWSYRRFKTRPDNAPSPYVRN